MAEIRGPEQHSRSASGRAVETGAKPACFVIQNIVSLKLALRTRTRGPARPWHRKITDGSFMVRNIFAFFELGSAGWLRNG